jgi:TonB family protein
MTDQLIDAALRGTFVLAAAWIATGILQRASADVRHRIWLAALAIVALLLIPIPVPDGMRIEIASRAHAAGVGSAPGNGPLLLLAAWAVGMMFMLARLGAGVARLSRITGRARRLEAERVLISDEITTPMTWGAIRPTILLPAYMEHWSVAKRAGVVLHERAHIARRDWAWQMFARSLTAVLWFHPLVWLAAARLRFEAERAADDRVLAEGIRATDYADRLVEVARLIRRQRGVFPAPLSDASVAMVRPSLLTSPLLTSRIDALLDPTRSHARASLVHRATVLMASTLLFLSLAAAQSQTVYKVADLSVPPRVASKVEPKYTAKARAAKIQGKVVLKMVIKANGRADQIQVAQSLDKGLDANAIAAIRKWHFDPGKKDGKMVPVAATIEVNFKLL